MIVQNSIVIFEGGDIGVAARYNEKMNIGELSFQELENNTEIGEKYESDDNYFPVSLIFKKTASIDVVIKQLQVIKEKMEDQENGK